MRILRARIGSFGKLRERNLSFDRGLNVVYGPNEIGKSTLRSFLTTTMFPKAPLKYPVSKASDSGSVDVVLEDGTGFTFERDGKKSSGLGSQLCGIDDKEYVSIYSMSPEDLRDVKGIEKGDIRNRFLTIPGGNDLPRAYAEIDQARTRLLPDLRRNSKCVIAALISEENDRRQEVRRLQSRESGDSDYARLTARRTELETELVSARAEAHDAVDRYSAASKLSGRSKDLLTIGELERTESELRYAENVDTAQYAVLKADLDRTDDELKESDADFDSHRYSVSGLDIGAYLSVASKIEHLLDHENEYDIQATAPAIEVRSKGCSKHGGLSLIGMAMAIAGLVSSMVVGVAGVAIAVAGAVLFAVSFRGKKGSKVGPSVSDASQSAKSALQRELDEVTTEVGLQRRDFHSDIRSLAVNIRAIREFVSAEARHKEAVSRHDAAEKSISLFLSGYGGIEGYLSAVEDSKRLAEIRPKIQALKESMNGIDMEVPDETSAKQAVQQTNDRVMALETELVRVKQELEQLSGDTTVEDAITAESEACNRVYSACYEWASLMLEKIILDRASSIAYDVHRPEVLSKADRLLFTMTDGRYALDTDPRRNELAVSEISGGEVKTVTEWSDGLEDQVKLSVKLSVASSLSKEKPPIILDDVLLTSDSIRKRNACKAIAELADESQIIYFTCDAETNGLLMQYGAKAIDLKIST